MKKLALTLQLLLLSCVGCAFFSKLASPLPPSVLFLSSEVVQSIQEIQQQYEIETVKCLTGYSVLDTIYVTSLEPTWLNAQDSVTASFRQCDQEDVVGYYHNHPGGINPTTGEWDGFCGFSIPDYQTFLALKDLKVAVLSCNTHTLVWMFRGNYSPLQWTGEPPEPEY